VTTTRAPSVAWELSAPESLVLRDGPSADRAQAIKLGLLELLTRNSLRLVDTTGRNWLGREQVEKLLVRGSQPLPDRGVLAPIAKAFLNTAEKRTADGKSGRAIKDVARTFATGQRTGGGKYVTEIILPELAARGLFVRQLDHVLGIFPRTRWFLTSEGERRKAALVDMLADGERELAGASSRDPRQAAAVLATAGAATLLMTSAYPEMAELSRRLRQDPGSGDGGGTIAAGGATYTDSPDETPSGPDFTTPQPSPTPTPTPEPEVDPGAFTFETTTFVDLDLSAFDGVDSAFDAVDSGVDAGGGDGGGGDGGGDGGGGGD
jgi:hypothetical protein